MSEEMVKRILEEMDAQFADLKAALASGRAGHPSPDGVATAPAGHKD
jgi:hypothetical protein